MVVNDQSLVRAARAYQRQHRVTDADFASEIGTTSAYWRRIKYGRPFSVALVQAIYRNIPALRSAALAHIIWLEILPMLQASRQKEPVIGDAIR